MGFVAFDTLGAVWRFTCAYFLWPAPARVPFETPMSLPFETPMSLFHSGPPSLLTSKDMGVSNGMAPFAKILVGKSMSDGCLSPYFAPFAKILVGKSMSDGCLSPYLAMRHSAIGH
jgi:hypothetical protein